LEELNSMLKITEPNFVVLAAKKIHKLITTAITLRKLGRNKNSLRVL